MKHLIATAAVLLATFTCFSQTVADAVNKSDSALLVQLIKQGHATNELDKNGTTPLMTAARWADLTIVRILLKNGVPPDSPRSAKGRTVLMVACAYYSGVTICKLLIEKGADVNVHSNDGVTPLMLAALNGKIDVVELLLAKGANPKAKDEKGLTALDYAVNADITEYITAAIKDTRVDKDAVIAKLKSAIGQ